MAKWGFVRGVHDVGNGLYGYVQPDGTWGWSNAGLVVSDGETLLVDTLMSVPLTREMLDQFKAKVPAAVRIDRLVNTHANPDHFFGNGLVADAEIIGTNEAKAEMSEFDPRRLATLRDTYPQMGDSGEFLYETMGRKFDFSGVDEVTLPNRTFDGRLDITVGSKAVELIDLGPAHTNSDTIVWVPGDRVVFTGDLLFNEGHPIMWAGPVENWIRACRRIEAMDVDVVVPGHGPIVAPSGAAAVRAYLEYVRDEARRRFDAGLSAADAARDIALGDFGSWGDAERIAVNVETLYREFDPAHEPANLVELFTLMGELSR